MSRPPEAGVGGSISFYPTQLRNGSSRVPRVLRQCHLLHSVKANGPRNALTLVARQDGDGDRGGCEARTPLRFR